MGTNRGYNGYGYIHINGYRDKVTGFIHINGYRDEVTGFIHINGYRNKPSYLITISIYMNISIAIIALVGTPRVSKFKDFFH